MRAICKPTLSLAALLLVFTVAAAASARPQTMVKQVRPSIDASSSGIAMTRPHTLALARYGIEAFVQNANALGWLDNRHAVVVQRLSKPARALVGWAESDVIGGGAVPGSQLALGGVRAIWTGYAGGASRETVIKTGALGYRPKPGQKRATIVSVFSYSNGTYEGTYLGGLAGNGTTLVFGQTDEECPGELCRLFEVSGGGVTRVLGRTASTDIPNVDPPAMLAASPGRIAVVPAASLPWPGAGTPSLPAVAENGPVNVYDVSGRLLASVHPAGTVRIVALAWPQLAVLVERHDQTMAIERYDAHGSLEGTTVVPVGASDLAVGAGGVVYRVGRKIYTIRSGLPIVLWHATGLPIGLSVEGRRVAWATNINDRGRIVALTLR